MFDLFFDLIGLVVGLYALLVLVHFILTLVKVPENKWTTLLTSIVEPALAPVRVLVNKYLPKNWQVIDWSPVALLIGISVAQWVLNLILGIIF